LTIAIHRLMMARGYAVAVMRSRISLTLVLAFIVVSLRPAVAGFSPALIVIYGSSLRAPIFVVKSDIATFGFLSCMSEQSSFRAESQRQNGRGYLNLSIFYSGEILRDPSLAEGLIRTWTPESGHQHGRLYLPTASEDALIVVTHASLRFLDTGRVASNGMQIFEGVGFPQPVPRDSAEFSRGCSLNPEDVKAGRSLGIPGL
jgi:hypothetical protein